jgi:hypothetical protein
MRPYRDVMRDIRAGRHSLHPLTRTSKEHVFSEGDYEIRSRMQALLGFLEDACLAIRLKAADERYLQLYFWEIVLQSYEKTKPWIDNERAIDGTRIYYPEFETIAIRWRAQADKSHYE